MNSMGYTTTVLGSRSSLIRGIRPNSFSCPWEGSLGADRNIDAMIYGVSIDGLNNGLKLKICESSFFLRASAPRLLLDGSLT